MMSWQEDGKPRKQFIGGEWRGFGNFCSILDGVNGWLGA